jgi:hypothetical protein
MDPSIRKQGARCTCPNGQAPPKSYQLRIGRRPSQVLGQYFSWVVPHTVPIIMTECETSDIGVDTRTPVDDFDYQLPFRFTGTIDKLTYKLGPEQLSADDTATASKMLAVAHD